jgi:hypothetical protein
MKSKLQRLPEEAVRPASQPNNLAKAYLLLPIARGYILNTFLAGRKYPG